MNVHELTFAWDGRSIRLRVCSPATTYPIDDYREVHFELPTKGRCMAVFFLLPDKSSSDPYSVKPLHEWDVPVRWDDPTMLYVPELHDQAILAAFKYIFENELEATAFEYLDEQ